MSAENKCEDCGHCKLIPPGGGFRHRYGMIAVNFGSAFLFRDCTTEEEKSHNLNQICDRPAEFVAKTEKIG